MKYVKFAIGGAGLLAAALSLGYGVLDAGGQGIVVLVASLIPVVLVGLGTLVWPSMPRWASITSCVAFLLVAIKTRVGDDLQNIMMAAVLGLLLAIVLAIKPERTRG